jgi:hypothetical protein
VFLALQQFDDKAVKGLDFRPPGLSLGEYIGGLEILEILVVALGQEPVIGALGIVSRLLHSFENRKVHPIVHVIVPFRRRAFFEVESDWVKNSESVVLVKDASNYEAACIGLQNDRFLQIIMVEVR